MTTFKRFFQREPDPTVLKRREYVDALQRFEDLEARDRLRRREEVQQLKEASIADLPALRRSVDTARGMRQIEIQGVQARIDRIEAEIKVLES